MPSICLEMWLYLLCWLLARNSVVVTNLARVHAVKADAERAYVKRWSLRLAAMKADVHVVTAIAVISFFVPLR